MMRRAMLFLWGGLFASLLACGPMAGPSSSTPQALSPTCDPNDITAEVCDGVDNDCNGQVDDGLIPPPCQDQLGACKGAVRRCIPSLGGWWVCSNYDYQRNNPKAKLGPETDCDGVDNNCNGQVDENCASVPCTTGQTRPCYSGPSGTPEVGQCKVGVQTCISQDTWGACSGDVTPVSELCDGQDNDCDGDIDEDCGLMEVSAGSGLLSSPGYRMKGSLQLSGADHALASPGYRMRVHAVFGAQP